ncbi:MAG: endonuclease/exonuclease/phosphatase family protein [Bacteroidota bacterium]|nr:endonuclease/exonuclease/phosphatase family protein [Bacteroidota bacterium]
MRDILKLLLILINIGFAALMIGAVLSRSISPDTFWPLAFLGLSFPALAITNFLFLIYWLILFKKPVFISLAVLILALPALNSSFRFFSKDLPDKAENSLSLMSYNVRLFDVFNWSGRANNGKELISFLGKSETDIICLQEFMENNTKAYNLRSVKKQLPYNPYSYINYNYQAFKRKHGLAIFSNYPILEGGKGSFSGTRNMFIYADVKLPKDTIRIFNVHLESIHLDYQQYNLIDSLNLTVNYSSKEELKRIARNVKQAFIKRSEQIEVLRKEVDKSPFPVIICGDFNDTPVSYTYKNLKKDLKDSFVESGKGMGASYQKFKLPLRIDYILHDQRLFSGRHEVIDVDYSDHKPIKANLWFKH